VAGANNTKDKNNSRNNTKNQQHRTKSQRNSKSGSGKNTGSRNQGGGQQMVVRNARGSREIKAVILIALGIFLILSLFGKTGLIGRAVVAVLYGLVGQLATIVLVVMLFVLAWCVLRGTSDTVFSIKNVLLFAFLLLLSAALVHTFKYGVDDYSGMKAAELIRTMWGQKHSGGVIGGMISYMLQRLVAKPGTLVILIPATIIIAMVLFSLSLVNAAKKAGAVGGSVANWFKDVAGRFKESSDARKRERAQQAAEQKAREKEREETGKNGSGAAEHGKTGRSGDAYDDADGVEGTDGEITSGTDDNIEFYSARDRKKDMYRQDLEKQREKRVAEERKIMSQEDDEDEDGSGTHRSSHRGFADAQTAAEYAAEHGLRGGRTAGSEYDSDSDDPAGAFADGEGSEPVTGEREQLPDPGATIPTKIPEENAEIKLVTADESIEYELPPVSLLREPPENAQDAEDQQSKARLTARKLEDVMQSFGIEARVIRISIGSTVTMFELQPQSGVKVSRIKNLSDDIALNLAASGVRILAPIPGKAAIGIEIPNEERRTVYLRELVETESFMEHRSKLAFCLGEDIFGQTILADISKMPHLLIAGTTNSGKSVCVNCLIMSLLFRCTPNDVRFIMIDPKEVELRDYNGMPHMLVPVVTEPKKAAAALAWAVQEMDNRYKQFAKYNMRDINAYNASAADNGLKKLPRIVIIIDELADLMMVARDSVEEAINRIAQKARAAGMHLIVATQRPSVDVITGLIKANIPSRIAFTVSSVVDSKTILDYGGAEKLLGKGDMLFAPVDAMKPTRVQGGFVSDSEIEDTTEFWKSQNENGGTDEEISHQIENARIAEKGRHGGAGGEGGDGGDPLFADAVDIAIETKQISASFLQRKLGLGYARASRLIDQMEEKGYISARDGNNPRQVLISQNPLR